MKTVLIANDAENLQALIEAFHKYGMKLNQTIKQPKSLQ